MQKIDMFNWATQHIPFMALMASKPPPNRPMLTRLSEQTVVAVVAAAIALYTNNAIHETKLAQLSMDVQSLTKIVNDMRHDLYVPRSAK